MDYRDHRPRHAHHPGERRFDNAFGGMWGGFGGAGERKRFFGRGKFKFALLELLASEPMHGYQLIKGMGEQTGGLYAPSPGSVYPNLQLLEDMQLIGSSEENGKKLYHITNEGRAFLRERGKAGAEPPGHRLEHHGPHRPRSGGIGKHHLRRLMKEWSEVIYLMASAAEAAQEHPSSKQAEQFRDLMAKFRESLKEIAASAPNNGMADDTDAQR